MTTDVEKEIHSVNLNNGPSTGFSTMALVLGILVIVLLVTIPLLLFPESEFVGSDGRGSEAVERIAPEYDSAWIANWWSPPGSETESMLFALQATVGGILIGYFFGFMRGRKGGQKERPDEDMGG